MKKDQLQDKYDEIFREIKEEKMEWSFDDFLQKAENANLKETPPLLFHWKKRKNLHFPNGSGWPPV
jgi:phage pi2 protein 07